MQETMIPNEDYWSAYLSHAIAIAGNITRLGKDLKMSRKTIHDWISGANKPTYSSKMRVIYYLRQHNVSIEHVRWHK
jgi:hypothetical protein